jgi:antitoxin VapB
LAFSVKDETTDVAVRRLARLWDKSLTETIKIAVEREYARSNATKLLSERLASLSARYRSRPETGLDADKAFFDELSGED